MKKEHKRWVVKHRNQKMLKKNDLLFFFSFSDLHLSDSSQAGKARQGRVLVGARGVRHKACGLAWLHSALQLFTALAFHGAAAAEEKERKEGEMRRSSVHVPPPRPQSQSEGTYSTQRFIFDCKSISRIPLCMAIRFYLPFLSPPNLFITRGEFKRKTYLILSSHTCVDVLIP